MYFHLELNVVISYLARACFSSHWCTEQNLTIVNFAGEIKFSFEKASSLASLSSLLKLPIYSDKTRLLNTSRAFSNEQHSEDLMSEFVVMAAKLSPGFKCNFDWKSNTVFG